MTSEIISLEVCSSCLQNLPTKKMFWFWHGFGKVRVCSSCWDKLEEREGNK